MKRYVKCLLALVLTVAMATSALPRAAFAAGETEPLRILTIGNSHSLDSTRLLAQVFEVHDPDREVILGTMYYSGCTMSQHVSFASDNSAVYSYNKNVDGVWSSIKESTLLTALEDETWDIVVLQEMNNQAAMESSFQNNNAEQLMNYVKSHQEKEPVFYWNMVWANPTDPTFWDPSYDVQPPVNWIKNYETRFDTDQIHMYELITANVQKYVETDPAIDTVFPTGTAVQYANHALGQTDLDLYRDYTHISDFARLMVAYLWYTVITGEQLTQVKVDSVPKILRHSRFQKYGDLTVTAEMKQVILEAVNYAVKQPYEVPDPPVTALRCEQCRTEPQWTAWDGSPLSSGDGHYYLTKNVNAAKVLLPTEGCISINLNGYTLTHSGTAFDVDSGVTLSVMDFKGGGAVRGTALVRAGGTLNVHSGTFAAIETEGGSLNIRGGQIDTVTAAGPVNVSRKAVIGQLTPVASPNLALGDILTVTGSFTGSVGLNVDTALKDGLDLGNSVDAVIGLETLYLIGSTNMNIVAEGTELILREKTLCHQCGIEVIWQTLNQANFDALGSHGLTPGHYVLGEDVSPAQQSLNKDGNKAGTYCLDLGGHTMSGASRAFLLYSGATLNVTDSVGGGIIEGQTSAAAAGGALYAYAGSAFHLYGGTMRYNTARSDISLSGGVIYMSGDFYLHGGRIEGGNVSNYGGTVYVGNGGSFTATGGQVLTGGASKGGPCVYVTKGGSVTLSGDAEIAELCFAGSSANTLTVEGSYTGSLALRYPETVELTELTDIGNSRNAEISHATITFTDATGMTAAVKDTDLVVSDSPYVYGTCEACGVCRWQPLNQADFNTLGTQGLTPGHYVLAEDVSPAQQILNKDGTKAGTYCLDLAGHIMSGTSRAFLLHSGATLNVTDSVGGGIMEGQTTAAAAGGVLYAYAGSAFHLYGGTMRYNTARSDISLSGGVIYMSGDFYLHGGRVEGGNVSNYGGTVYLGKNASFTASGGQVLAGAAVNGGGCVYAAQGGTVTLSSDAEVAEICFAGSSADTLTIHGRYTGTVALQYPSSVSLTDGTVLGAVSPAGDLSNANISITDTSCKTVAVSGDTLLIDDQHTYQTTTTAPTCTQKGYTTYTCHCGDTYTADEVAALDHSYKSDTVVPTCTTDGSITITCTACGDTKVAIIPAAGHSYTEGVCGVCGAGDPDYVTIPTLKLKAPTLEFKDMICVVAFYTAENIEDVVEMGMITYKEKVSEHNIETADHVIPGATYEAGSGRYFSSSQGIHAKYLGDTVYLAIYAKLSDGSYVYSSLASYSPVQYATSQLKNSTDTNLKQLVAAMLNYGAEAQLYFGHNVENLANATLTEYQKALPESYREDMTGSVPSASKEKQGSFASNTGFGTRKPAISFEGAFCINYFFTPNYAPVDGITLYYWNEADYNAADVLTVENATGSLQMDGSGVGQYRGDVTGISAKALSQAVYVAAVYSDGTTTWTSGVLGYSIGAYCSSQASKGGDVAELAKATAVYGYHAKQYFG